MTLEEIVGSLPEQAKVELAIHFLEIGLPIWEKFAKESAANLTYYAFLLGMETVDPKFVAYSIQLAKQWISPLSFAAQENLKAKLEKLIERFAMHLSGIRDWELEIAPHPQLIFYAASNLLYYIDGETMSSSKESMVYISINQSMDAIVKEKLLTWEEVNAILTTYQ